MQSTYLTRTTQKCHKYKGLGTNLLPQLMIANCQQPHFCLSGESRMTQPLLQPSPFMTASFFLFAVFHGDRAQKTGVSAPNPSNPPMGSTDSKRFPIASSPDSGKPAIRQMEMKHSGSFMAQDRLHSRQGGHKNLVLCRTGLFNLLNRPANTSQSSEQRT